MNYFNRKNGELFCEEVAVAEIAAKVGTPFYLYSKRTLLQHFNAFDSGFAGIDHLTCFAVKACSNIAILNLFSKTGGGADIVSQGELFRALKAGVPSDRIIFSGVGKTEEEMRYALDSQILMFNIESAAELDRLQQVAVSMGKEAPVAFRVNPDVDPLTHAYISTGLAKNKFGIPIQEAMALYERAAAMDGIAVKGISCHIGSQLTLISPFVESMTKIRAFVKDLASRNIIISHIDLGGGVGITYDDETPPHPHEYAEAIRSELKDLGCTLILEPGRVIVGNAGILVTEVQYTKVNRGGDAEKKFVIVDAAMNDLARPCLYGAYHTIQPVQDRGEETEKVDVVGPICETGDFLAQERELPRVSQGDLLAVMSAGAYGFSMASNYNSRTRVPEVLVDGDSYAVIRRRETMDDLIQGESIPM